ncbi:Uncharacterised protein [Escherichia coli]|nr:Uncharacterised protein [Escherichia coli]
MQENQKNTKKEIYNLNKVSIVKQAGLPETDGLMQY